MREDTRQIRLGSIPSVLRQLRLAEEKGYTHVSIDIDVESNPLGGVKSSAVLEVSKRSETK